LDIKLFRALVYLFININNKEERRYLILYIAGPKVFILINISSISYYTL